MGKGAVDDEKGRLEDKMGGQRMGMGGWIIIIIDD